MVQLDMPVDCRRLRLPSIEIPGGTTGTGAFGQALRSPESQNPCRSGHQSELHSARARMNGVLGRDSYAADLHFSDAELDR
jgi:hypothetical protein